MAYANNYTNYSCDFYPSTPNASTLQQNTNVAAATQAAALAALLVLYPNAVVVSITPDTDTAPSVNLPSAVSGTTSPATLYSVDFYPTAAASNVLQQNFQVIANSVAQAIAVVVNYFPSAVILAVGSVTLSQPGALALQTS